MDWREHVCSLQVVKESCTAALEIMSKLLKAVMPRPLLVITSMVTISCSYYLMSSKYTSEYVLVVITKSDLYS